MQSYPSRRISFLLFSFTAVLFWDQFISLDQQQRWNSLFAEAKSLWPLPLSPNLGNDYLVVADPSSFKWSSPGHSSSILTNGIARYQQLIFPPLLPETIQITVQPATNSSTATLRLAGTLLGVEFSISSNSTDLHLGVDESYNLTTIASPTVGYLLSIRSNTVYGALRGLETVSQLLDWNGNLFLSILFAVGNQ